MSVPRRVHAACLLIPLLVAFAAPADGPAFGPEEGVEVTKTFAFESSFELDDLSILADGQDIGEMLGTIEASAHNEQTIRVSDVYGATKDGRPARVERTFDDVTSVMSLTTASDMGGGDDRDVPSSSELEGYTVVFTWNADEGKYDVAFEDDSGDEDLLEGLEEDMDLRFLLPKTTVAEGDSWEVPIRELSALLMPGGNLSILPEDFDAEDAGMFEEIFGEGFGDKLADLFEGTCTCTYRSTEEIDGVKVANIDVAIEVTTNADLSELLMDLVDRAGDEFPEGLEIDIDAADLSIDFEGEGVLQWALDRGHVHRFEVSGDTYLGIDLGVSVDMAGEGGSFELGAELSGQMGLVVETER